MIDSIVMDVLSHKEQLVLARKMYAGDHVGYDERVRYLKQQKLSVSQETIRTCRKPVWRPSFVKQASQASESRQLLVMSNMRLVFANCRNFSSRLPWDDLVQAGTLGLMEGLDKFDPYRGVRLSTFCTYYIRKQLFSYLNLGQRVPMKKQWRTWWKTWGSFRERREVGGEDNTLDLAAENLGWGQQRVMLMGLLEAVSVQSFSYGLDDPTVAEYSEIDHDVRLCCSLVYDAMNQLPDKYRDILERSFGLGVYEEPQSGPVIAEAYSVSKQWIHRLIREALDEIRAYVKKNSHSLLEEAKTLDFSKKEYKYAS